MKTRALPTYLMVPLKWSIWSTIASLLFVTCSFYSVASESNLESIDEYIELIDANNKAMFSLAIVENGEVLYQNQIGHAFIGQNNAKHNLADKQTRYTIASITKTFTATMIFQLIEQGELSLKTELSEFYPNFEKSKSITIAHLLAHQSGLFNYTDSPEFASYFSQRQTNQQMLDRFYSYRQKFEPGTSRQYSNTGYYLLGLIIEDVTGDSYEDNLKTHITDKLKLRNTSLCRDYSSCNFDTQSYTYWASDWFEQSVWDPSVSAGAGGIISTPSDLGIFIDALFKGKLVSLKTVNKMKAMNTGVGKGLWYMPYYGKMGWGHNGLIEGFQSQLIYFDKEDVAFAITANGLNESQKNIMNTVIGLYFNQDVTLPNYNRPFTSIAAEELNKYLGHYKTFSMPLEAELFLENDQLMGRWTGQDAIAFQPLSNTEFESRENGILLKFVTSPSGNINYRQATLYQRDWELEFYRK
ncbi:beta-lactamase family protein [Vibrio lamellibrachiae]|uniref:serine hydrolase domain-containing protein n=1 Tax=Vibrio lamellibrachiae TaxID=2910253 RepID=UPI003D136B70